MTEEIENISEEIENIEFTQEEYEGTVENQDSEYEEVEQEKPKEKEKKYLFKTLKDFNGTFSYSIINKVLTTPKYLRNFADAYSDAMEDDYLLEYGKNFYPNLEPIKSPIDRDIIRKMILQGDEEKLCAGSAEALKTILQNNKHVGLIFRTDIDEIVGIYEVIHRNRITCDLVINVRGCHKQRAKTAKEMILYFGGKYARMIYEQGYQYAMASILTFDKQQIKTLGNINHSALVQHIQNKECKIIKDKLKIEKPNLSADELQKEAFKLIAGFKNTGTVMPRNYAGWCPVWESNWRYDLSKKFNEQHISKQ